MGDSDYAAAYILCMRALGLSQGRGDGDYGPDRELNRGQMASFLIRLWTEHLGRQCPTGVVVPFTDTGGNTHEANIDCLFGLVFNSEDSGNSCEFTVVLPDRLNQVEIQLDRDSPPDPASATIHLLATERKCASGREMGDALRGPQVVETDSAVIVAFAAIEANEPGFTCQDNPSTPVTVELSQPLGNRTIHDGLYVPPKALDPIPARE